MSKRPLGSPPPSSPSRVLFGELQIQAHEATLIRNHDSLAQSVEYSQHTAPASSQATAKGKGKAQTRLIRWVPEDSAAWLEEDPLAHEKVGGSAQDEPQYWVDRYDILNLLTALPSPRSHPPSPALSAGFSELGSDHEEMFFFDQQTQADIYNKKKRRRLEDSREERVRRLEEDGRLANGGRGGNDDDGDEPSPTQSALMTKLAATLASSPSPALLELRILANHGSDPRFAFLRKGGKWCEHWAAMRAPKLVLEAVQAPEAAGGGGGGGLGLVAYDSDSDSGSDDEVGRDKGGAEVPLPIPSVEGGAVDGVDEEERAKKEAKAVKARAWAAKRREAREAAEASTS